MLGFAIAVAGRAFAGGVVLPDPSSGNVNGLAGVLYWPATMPVAGESVRPLPLVEGCRAHLVSESDPEKELEHPCGKWFAPPVGKYRVWLESDGSISPTQALLVFAGTAFRGQGLSALMPVAASGRIGIPPDRALPESESVRLFSTRTTFPWAKSARIFDRRLRDRVVQMPAGDRVILGRFDRRTNDAIALSRPVTIKARETQYVWPGEPTTSDVLVILRKPPALQVRKTPPSAGLSLNGRKADVLVNGSDRIVAVWYGVDAPRAKIAFHSDAARWEAREIRLTPGRIATIRDEVQPLPSAKVSVNAPVNTRFPDEVFLEVARAAEKEVLRRVSAGLGVHELAELPAELLRVTLRLGQWEWSKMLDLSRGEDGQVGFDIEPVTIFGTVYHGREPAQAELSFLNGDDRWAVVNTDERGRYETTLWWTDVQTVRVTLPGLAPFLDPFREIFTSGRVDFHVPRTDYRVRVRDAQTGRGIAGARVTAGSETGSGLRVAQRVTTNGDGEARLPPVRDGALVVHVSADNYASAEPRRMVVDDEHHTLEFALQPLRTVATVRVLLPSGAPAAGAEVWAFDPAMRPAWRGSATAEGVLELPDLPPGALLLVRHPQAATGVRRTGDREWRLEAPREPLTLEAEANAPIAVWLDDIRLSGPALSFAAWSGPSANPHGRWVGRNLPRRELTIATGENVRTISP